REARPGRRSCGGEVHLIHQPGAVGELDDGERHRLGAELSAELDLDLVAVGTVGRVAGDRRSLVAEVGLHHHDAPLPVGGWLVFAAGPAEVPHSIPIFFTLLSATASRNCSTTPRGEVTGAGVAEEL